MLKVADKCFWEKDRIDNHFPKLDHDIEVDVLIIGGGVSGALSTYIFQEKKISVAVIERGEIEDEVTKGTTSHEDIDTDVKKISSYLDGFQAMDAFRFTLETIYKLDDVTDNLADKCDFIRRPSIHYAYQERKNENQFIFPFSSGNLSYHSGATVNSEKLTKEIFKYCAKLDVPIYQNTEVYEFNIEDDGVKVVTKDKKQIKCKKVLMASGYDSSLFFDSSIYGKTKPVESFRRWRGSLLNDSENLSINQVIDKDEVNELESLKGQDKHPLTQYKYQILENNGNDRVPFIKTVEYHFNELLPDTNLNLPYIDEHDDYPNIYFNLGIGNNGLLYALMGAMLLSDKYLGIHNKRLNIFKFNR